AGPVGWPLAEPVKLREDGLLLRSDLRHVVCCRLSLLERLKVNYARLTKEVIFFILPTNFPICARLLQTLGPRVILQFGIVFGLLTTELLKNVTKNDKNRKV